MIGSKMQIASSMPEYTGTVLLDNPVALYMFDETSGAAIDLSGNGYDLQPIGSAERSWDRVIYNQLATLFNNNVYYISTFTGGMSSTEISLETWVTPSSNSSNHYMIVHEAYDPLIKGFDIRVHSGTVRLTVGSGDLSAKVFSSPFTLNAGERYHIVGTLTSTEGELWINGESVVGPTAHEEGADWLNKSTWGLVAGAFAASPSVWLPTGDSYQTGTALYNQKLTQNQIQTHFRAGREGF